jgi:hypothetical protein
VRLESNKKPVRSSGGIDCWRTPLCLRSGGEKQRHYTKPSRKLLTILHDVKVDTHQNIQCTVINQTRNAIVYIIYILSCSLLRFVCTCLS